MTNRSCVKNAFLDGSCLGIILRRHQVPVCLGLLLVVNVSMLAWSAVRQAPTVDEPLHLAAGIRHWRFGQFDWDPGNTPLVALVSGLATLPFDPKLPAGDLKGDLGTRFMSMNGVKSLTLITVGRWACIPFSVLGGYVCFLWARELYGSRAGLLSCLLWCFCTETIANGQLITSDLPGAAVGVLASYHFWKWLQAPSMMAGVGAGILLGLAQLTRFVLVILYPIWFLAWLAHLLVRLKLGDRKHVLREFALCCLMLVVSVWVINLGYAFEGSFNRIRDYHFYSRFLSSHFADGKADSGDVVGWIPVPLPSNYVGGMDQAKNLFESEWSCYLGGVWKEGGWWYYYLYALLVKIPTGYFYLFALSLFAPLLSNKCWAGMQSEAFLWAAILGILGFVSWATHTSLQHMRQVLPILPFLFIWMSKTACIGFQAEKLFYSLVVAAVSWIVVSGIWTYPHAGSYFNELAGGPKHGHEHLLDSSIDWGQDLLYFKDWLDDHPHAQPLRFAYFGRFNPSLLGIEYTVPSLNGPEPGWHAISVSLLHGGYWAMLPNEPARRGRGIPHWAYEYFLEFEPVAMAGYSIYIYHISLDEANRVRRKLGLKELSEVDSVLVK